MSYDKAHERDQSLDPERKSSSKSNAAMLGPLPTHIDLGERLVGERETFLAAAPFLLRPVIGVMVTRVVPLSANASRPSAFKDKLGLDPAPTRAAEAATCFAVESPDRVSLVPGMVPPPLQLAFEARGAGRVEANIVVQVVNTEDGTSEQHFVRVSAVVVQDRLRAPDAPSALANHAGGPALPVTTPTSFDHAADLAEGEAAFVATRQVNGVDVAADNIKSYSKAPLPPDAFDQLIDLAITMGVSGIAGIVSKFVVQRLISLRPKVSPPDPTASSGTASSSPAQVAPEAAPQASTPAPDAAHASAGDAAPLRVMPVAAAFPMEKLTAMVTDGVKDGFKNISKPFLKTQLRPAKAEGPSSPGGDGASATSAAEPRYSSNWQIDFIHRHKDAMAVLAREYRSVVVNLRHTLAGVDPAVAQAAMEPVLYAFNGAAPRAAITQARATELQWIAAVARHSHGEVERELPDGSKHVATNLDRTRDAGARGWYKPTPVPTHDGVLDIHVSLPVGETPVEISGFKVRGAAITGVSQEVADSLPDTKLAAANIPIRLVLDGHPTLITRDELGSIRVNGYLLTKEGARWTEAHMRRGATLLMEKVLARSLREWGIDQVTTDDATGRNEKKS